eukprot:CAMPEP_0119141798 /NCGR_PEP_ID=MMETSP1310-20130426/31623_1 /TAXON_ID=464262 /ORGANISM="Genus nov. species nov., Strain RCC2339" /LENGTH=170 /DNA_ID=CAMNT_0007133283 /DNA_START=17 /DNA_END=529 /DNA_ORIENTATION=-
MLAAGDPSGSRGRRASASDINRSDAQREKAVAAHSQPTAAKVSCSQANYLVTPSIALLQVFTWEQLAAVPGFKIEDRTWGQVEWMGPVDLRDAADLAKSIVISKGQLYVHSNGLKRRALVTFKSIKKPSGKTPEEFSHLLQRVLETAFARVSSVAYDATKSQISFVVEVW